jgi:DNA-binding MarR family transcriptional regulator
MTKPKTSAQVELFKADVSWFHIFKELIRSKTWAKMSPQAKALYPVIKAFTNWQDGHAFPSFDTLQEYSGLGRASISKAVKELEALGYVRREKQGTGRASTQYRLLEKFSVEDAEGRPSAVATFDYLPGLVKDATAELKNFIAQGMNQDGKLQYIHIEKLNLTINHAGRDVNHAQGDQTVVNEAPDAWHLAAQRWAGGELTDAQYRAELRRLEAAEPKP